MTKQTRIPEGDQPLYKEKSFWTHVVLPIVVGLGCGAGAGAIADHEAKHWEKALQSNDVQLTSPQEAQPTPIDIR